MKPMDPSEWTHEKREECAQAVKVQRTSVFYRCFTRVLHRVWFHGLEVLTRNTRILLNPSFHIHLSHEHPSNSPPRVVHQSDQKGSHGNCGVCVRFAALGTHAMQ